MKGTVKEKGQVERLFQRGRRSTSSLLTILALQRDDGEQVGRCAFIAGKKLGCAPLRNRCKRVLRESARALGAPWDGYDIALVAKRPVARASQEEILKSLSRQLEKVGVR